MDVLHCHCRLCRRKSAVCKCRFVHFGLTDPSENCDGFSKWGGKHLKDFVTAKKFCLIMAPAMGSVRQLPARAGNVEKESVWGCKEWFYSGVSSSPWSQPCVPDEQTRLGTFRDNFGCWLSPLSLFREEILATCLCFPWCSIFSVCTSPVAAGVQQTSSWSYQFRDYYFSPQSWLLWLNDGL